MWLNIPTIDSIIASTSPITAAFFWSIFPFIVVSLGITIAVAVAIFLMAVFSNAFHRISYWMSKKGINDEISDDMYKDTGIRWRRP